MKEVDEDDDDEEGRDTTTFLVDDLYSYCNCWYFDIAYVQLYSDYRLSTDSFNSPDTTSSLARRGRPFLRDYAVLLAHCPDRDYSTESVIILATSDIDLELVSSNYTTIAQG